MRDPVAVRGWPFDKVPPGFRLPCRAGQWGDGRLAVRTASATPPYSLFNDIAGGLAPDGNGGVFALALIDAQLAAIQGPAALQPIAGTGLKGPIRYFDLPIGWVGVIGQWAEAAIVPSAPGSCIMVWTNLPAGTRSIVAQRFDAMSQPMWAAPSITVSESYVGTVPPRGLVAEPDGAGGAVLAGYFAEVPPGNFPIRVQRVSATGAAWPFLSPAGLLEGRVLPPISLTGPPMMPHWLQLVADGSGGAFVIWPELLGNGNCDLKLQHVDSAGALSGTVATLVSDIPYNWQSRFRLRRAIPDSGGGLYLAYTTSTPAMPGVPRADILHCLRYTAAGGVRWRVDLDPLVHPQAFHIAEDGAGGALVTSFSVSTFSPDLNVRRIDDTGAERWRIAPLKPTLPPAAPMFSGERWARFAQGVSDGAGGAILVFQDWPDPMGGPRLQTICFDARGVARSAQQPVTARPTGQDLPLVAAAGRDGAFVGWADDGDAANSILDLWVQRVGCCPLEPEPGGIGPGPQLPCEILPLYGLPPREFAVELPCGNRDHQFGLVPLPRLGALVPGLDLPPSFAHRAAPKPDWVRLLVTGLPRGYGVSIETWKGKRLAEPHPIGDRDGAAFGCSLTFKPGDANDMVLVVSHDGPPERADRPLAALAVEWGMGEPPAPPAFAKEPKR